MAGLDDLLTPQENTIVGDGGKFTFVDADTIRLEDGSRMRLQGINAPETTHFADGRLKSGEVGGQMTTQQVWELANKMGFTNPASDGTVDDTGTRIVGDLLDKDGRSFRRALAREGIVDVSAAHDTSGLAQSRDYGAFTRTKVGRETTAWDEARANIDNAIADEQRFENKFKRAQLYAGQAHGLTGYDAENYNQQADFEYSDRDTATGKANDPMSAAWDTGLTSVVESGYGVLEMLGESIDNEWLDTIGEAGINRAQTRMQDKGHFISDYKKVDDFDSAMEFLGTNFAMSLPYMAGTIGGTLFAPITGGASLAVPVGMYAGNTWNEMEGENRNAAVAIGAGVAQAALDRMGIGFIFKSGVAPKKLLKEAVEHQVKQGMSREAAEKMVVGATRAEIASFTKNAADAARRQIKAKQVVKDLALKVGVGATGEGATEAMQETIGYLAAHNTGEGFNWEDMADRAVHAVVAGASLGGVFGAPGAVANSAAWADVVVRQQPAEAKRLSQAGKWAEHEKENFGRIATNAENAAQARARVATQGVKTSLDDRAAADKQRKRDRTWGEFMSETALSAPALWQGATRFIFGDDIKNRSRAARILGDMFGGGLQKTFSGANYESEKHHRVTIYKNMVPIPEKVYQTLGGGKRMNKARRGEISDKIYAQLNEAITEDGKFDPNLVTGENADLVRQLGVQLNQLSDRMFADQKAHNPELGYIQNYLFKAKSFDKYAINKNRQGFQQALMDRFNFSAADAKDLTDAILDNAEVNTLDEAFSVTQGGIVPGSHRSRSLKLSEQAEFQEFMERDIFANVANAAKSAARYTAHRDFVGENGDVIAQLLDEMEAEGIPKEQVDKIAAQMKNYLDAESGNFKRPTSDMGKKLFRVQKNFMMFTTMAGLPLAVVSSLVEVALTQKGLTKDQVFGKDGGLQSIGNELGSMLTKGMGEIADVARRKQGDPSPATAGQEKLQELGYYQWDVGAATVTGVSETNPWQQTIYEGFFKWSGLSGWTNYTRAVRASMAGDYFTDKLEIIMKQRDLGEPKTNEVQEAEESLRNLGINVDNVIDALRNNDEAVLAENFREGAYNFVNEAVALPGAANRPLIYQDPRFALFTQFQGFMATFTANHIPKLWGEYVKRGTPAMKYNAFATMTTMIMLGFASQALKDWLKYDEDERRKGFAGNPYLDKAEYLQRGVRASGLLGTGERVLDQFFPLYETRSDNPGEWIWNTTTGESPSLSNIKRIGKTGKHLLEGDFEKAATQAGKSTPYIGPFSGKLGSIIKDTWNFLGE